MPAGFDRPFGAHSDVLDALRTTVEQDRATNIGFPAATDIDYGPVLPLFGRLLNNVGDPYVDPAGAAHTKAMEREVVSFLADLFRAPADDRWGYVTAGGTESNLYALNLARGLYPDALVYASEAAHYSVEKAVRLLNLPTVTVRVAPTGEMDYDDLRWVLGQHRDRPAIVVANVGTTMTEAVDDVRVIKRVLGSLAFRDQFVHSDAALAGIPLALVDERPGLDFADGADSISVSGHKYLGTPIPCGVVLTRRSLQQRIVRPVSYTGTPDTTIGGSRSGHAALLLWYALQQTGVEGLRQRAVHARQLAAYAVDRLSAIGWEAWRAQPHAFTVVLQTPPPRVSARWTMASSGRHSHIICMPGVTREQVDLFVEDIRAAKTVSASAAMSDTLPERVRHAARVVQPRLAVSDAAVA